MHGDGADADADHCSNTLVMFVSGSIIIMLLDGGAPLSQPPLLGLLVDMDRDLIHLLYATRTCCLSFDFLFYGVRGDQSRNYAWCWIKPEPGQWEKRFFP